MVLIEGEFVHEALPSTNKIALTCVTRTSIVDFGWNREALRATGKRESQSGQGSAPYELAKIPVAHGAHIFSCRPAGANSLKSPHYAQARGDDSHRFNRMYARLEGRCSTRPRSTPSGCSIASSSVSGLKRSGSRRGLGTTIRPALSILSSIPLAIPYAIKNGDKRKADGRASIPDPFNVKANVGGASSWQAPPGLPAIGTNSELPAWRSGTLR